MNSQSLSTSKTSATWPAATPGLARDVAPDPRLATDLGFEYAELDRLYAESEVSLHGGWTRGQVGRPPPARSG